MKIAWLLFRNNSSKTVAIVLLGLLSGAASTGLIAAANNSLYSGPAAKYSHWMLALAFTIAVVVKVGANLSAGLLLGRRLQDITLSMCSELCRKVAATPLPKLEEIGGPRVMTCLTDDIDALSSAIYSIPGLIIDLAMLGGCGIYLAWISRGAAIAVLVLVVLVTLPYRFLVAKATVSIIRVRDSRDTLFQHFRALVEGIKEIKLHNGRKNAFLEEDVDGTAKYIRQQNILAMNRYALADGWSQFMYFILLGVVLFAFPSMYHVSPKTLTAYVFISLYMMGPILGLVGSIPPFIRGQASLDKLGELDMALDNISHAAGADDSSSIAGLGAQPITPVSTPPLIEFRNVVFRRNSEKNDNAFTLGPIDLTLHPGELVFIIGGNGSGKSTLAKIITGLYPPQSGEILVDGVPVSSGSQDSFRQLYSAVFSDFFLFNRLVGLDHSNEWAERTNEYLEALDLAKVVKLNGAKFSTTSLSQGQRRRLALLVAYIEDRPVYVLDEWAADQDPEFRQIFYMKLLPELKEKGKTVVVITHDDRYFHLGDRVIKLDYGKVIESQRQDEPMGAFRS
jgi:putative ATP-binding cassette transporter